MCSTSTGTSRLPTGGRATRRALLSGGLAAAGGALLPWGALAHTPYRQWKVFRQRHFVIGALRDTPTYPLAKEFEAFLKSTLPEASPAVARAPQRRRLLDLFVTNQVHAVLLPLGEARALAGGEDPFRESVDVRVLRRFGDHVLLVRPSFPDNHVRLLADAFDEHGEMLPFPPTTEGLPVPLHVAADPVGEGGAARIARAGTGEEEDHHHPHAADGESPAAPGGEAETPPRRQLRPPRPQMGERLYEDDPFIPDHHHDGAFAAQDHYHEGTRVVFDHTHGGTSLVPDHMHAADGTPIPRHAHAADGRAVAPARRGTVRTTPLRRGTTTRRPVRRTTPTPGETRAPAPRTQPPPTRRAAALPTGAERDVIHEHIHHHLVDGRHMSHRHGHRHAPNARSDHNHQHEDGLTVDAPAAATSTPRSGG